MRVSVVILPVFNWREGQRVWRRAEEIGFHAAYTYDHLSWRSFKDGPWHAAIPTLTAAATVTERMRLGTLVTSPNFRHPVTLAKDLMTLDDVAGGRITLGVGAGTTGFDAVVLGIPQLSAKDRAERFADFVHLLDLLLTQPTTTYTGPHYTAHAAAMHPGTVQQPRIPFAIAAGGPKGRALVAKYGQSWVCTGHPDGVKATHKESVEFVRAQRRQVQDAFESAGRDPSEVDTLLLTGFTSDETMSSYDNFTATVERYTGLVNELVVHWPLPDTIFGTPPHVLEEIAERGIAAAAGR